MSKSYPMLMVCVAVLIGLDLFMVIATGTSPLAMMKAHLPLTIPVIPYGIGGTTVGILPWMGSVVFNCATRSVKA